MDDQPRILQSAQFVTGIVQELMASDGIPPEKIVIGGFSQGGAVALTAALHGLGKGEFILICVWAIWNDIDVVFCSQAPTSAGSSR